MITKEKTEKLLRARIVQEVKLHAQAGNDVELILTLVRFGQTCREIGIRQEMQRNRRHPPEQPEMRR